MTPKRLEKIRSLIIDSALEEIDAMSIEQLQKVVADAVDNVADAQKKLEDSEGYKKAKAAQSQSKSDLQTVTSALRELKTYQNAKAEYALLRRRELKGEDMGEFSEILSKIRLAIKNTKPKRDEKPKAA